MTTDTPAFDAAMVRRWLGILHGDSPGHIHICSTGDWAGQTFDHVDQAADYAARLDTQHREGIYARVTTLRAALDPGKRGGASDSAALPALWADIDIAGPGHEHQVCADTCPKRHTHITRPLPPDTEAAKAIVAASGLPTPTLWIHSGGGTYPIWLLDQPHQTTDEALGPAMTLAAGWQRAIEHAATALGWWYGRGVGDLARVLRIPGTLNRKAGLARPCRIVDATATRYTLADLQAALDVALAAIPTPEQVVPGPGLVGASRPATPRPEGQLTPGDDFAARVTWAEILEPAGWRAHYSHDDVTYWTRPAKPSGISASTNALGTDRLHVFTTSTEFEANESYSKLAAHAILNHRGDMSAAARELGRQGYGSPPIDYGAQQRQLLADILGPAATDPQPTPTETPAARATPGRGAWTAEVDVSNQQLAADWLRDQVGRSRLAGYFHRAGAIVYTPREGEAGYLPLGDGEDDEDGPAQIRAVTDSELASRISFTYGCYKLIKRGDDWVPNPSLFPKPSARAAIDAPDLMPHLRTLRGVVHSPVLRADGTVLEQPGYDPATGQLHLPEAGLVVPPVPERPTGQETADAVALLGEMVDGFTFVSKDDRASFLGVLLTPLIRAIAPPPYQLAAITAPQPGSGKTLLASLARTIHGGVFRAELPRDDDELRKQITTILDYTTAPIVHIDNVTGTVRSSIIAGLTTSPRWDDRLLGTNQLVNARNDRLWIITGNNLSLGGDLARRTLWITIDPGVPHPELRTGFAIADLERWTRDHRGQLLHALLTLVRSWVAAGRPAPPARSSDSYSRWTQTIGGILANAGVEGVFGGAESASKDIGADDQEWHEFLTHIHRAIGESEWTVKDLLAKIDNGNLLAPGPIPLDALPAELAEKASRPNVGIAGIAKSLGRWLLHRDGRWAGGLTVRSPGTDRTKVRLWKIHTTGGDA